MTLEVPDPNEILSYALQRRALITQACELLATLGMAVDRSPLEPDVALRAMAFNWAVNVHPDLMRMYRDAAQGVQWKCRMLRIEHGVDTAEPIERLVLRDLNTFTSTIDTQLAFPTEMQKRISEAAEPLHSTTTLIAPLRLITVLPGVMLLAWDQEWRDAIETFGQYAGQVTQTPAAVDAFHSRIDNLEESVQLMINRFIALSAAAEIPATYRRG